MLRALREHSRDPVYANGVALVANAGLSAALGFVFWMVAARRFNADALGVGAAVVSAATLAALVGKAGFDAAVIRFAPSASSRGVRRVLARAILAATTLTALVAGAVLVFAIGGMPALGALREPAYAAGFVLLAVGTAGAWILDSFFIAESAATAVLWRNVAFNVVKIGVPLLLVASWAGRAVPLAWGLGLAASLVVAIALLPRRLRAHSPTGVKPARGALGYAMRNYALNLSEFLPGLVLPLVVLHALGAEENARFFLAWTIATVAFLASKAIAQSAFAALVRDGQPRAALGKALRLSALVLAPAALAMAFGAPLLLSLFGAHYVEAAGLLRILAWSVPGVVVLNLYLAYLKARDDGWELTLLPVANLAILLPAMPLALARWGIEGAGLVWLAVTGTLGLYAAARLVTKLQRDPDATPRTGLRRHPHQG
jgi:O-antigen/teichoic acid export membrane protein